MRANGGRPWAWVLSLLLVGLQFLGLAHLGLERHGVCWEHGTLTELGSSRATLSEFAPVNPQLGLHARRASAAALDDAEGHHHCPVQTSRRDWGAPPAGAPLVLALSVTAGDVGLSGSAPRADAGLLGRAPKQSPPPTA